MKRVFPAPLLSLALAGVWLLVNRTHEPGQWLMAALLGFAVPLLVKPLRPTPVHFRNAWVAFKLFWKVGYDVIWWNWRVMIGTVTSVQRMPRGAFVKVPLDLHDPNGLAVLAAILCVIPGTIWSELALDRSALLVHIFDLRVSEEEEAALIKERYERPLIEIFQSGEKR
jgi:multicomponent K+:H+ antiporter subunit E